MAISVASVYLEVCDAILEPGGLTGETLTDSDFLQFLNDCLRDFFECSNGFQKFQNIVSQLGVRIYDHPYFVNQPQVVLIDESNLFRGSGNYWDNSDYRWQQLGPGTPQEWRNDQVQENEIEVRPAPAWNGYQPIFNGGMYGNLSTTSGAVTFDIAYDPASTGMYGTISACDYGDVYVEFSSPMFGTIGGMAEATLNITEITTYTPDVEIDSLTAYIPDLPDSFQQYVVFGILTRAYQMDGELKNENLAKYYGNRFQEIVRILRSVCTEALLEVIQK